ncbi:RagB/SusD family nutrient uptake outer membrane protein [Chitinophaga sp. Cy-1792]|uniref:RagB/SusD family nutrient uptake outer membrane protein n=1 Tax=Chitinophaga sp. Cy-1792 TaxID=2608339 RepID=UPI00141EFB5F|nr:RagB/SusD family nutrient uptake outer membrane protein [Chitinophaga sp. Cy-1792]
MKSNIYIASILLLLFASSCTRVLEKNSLNQVDSDAIWKDENLTRLFLNNIYANRPGFDNGNPPIQDNICDETRIGASTGNPFNILAGAWTSSSNYFDYWAYADVRKANEFIQGITTKSTIKESLKKQYLGEAKFLRAITYFDMVKRYGGVPIITEPQDINDDLLVKRNTIDECYQFIVKECDEAAAILPDKGQTQTGRATRGAALALKSRALLFYASQLYNTTNDKTRWENAAQAAKAVMDLKQYSLYGDVRRIMLDKSNSEVIFEVQYSKPDKEHGWDAQAKPLSLANGIGPKRCPLQELVDAFPMANGYGISQAQSGYDPNNPYVGRDKRFYAAIVYNGSDYCGRTQYTHVDDPDGIGKSFCTTTGYYQRKGVDETNKGYSSGKGSDQNWIEIRYAEILLNYAEARNEATGPDGTVLDALNTLRTRAGITNQLTTDITQDSMRNLIRNERYVELCIEMKRYWDLRRWKIADNANVLNGRRYTGMKITKVGNGWKYERVVVDPKPSVFLPYMYYMPIPFSEMIKNSNLKQNDNW